MKIKNLQFEKNIFLAPMAGYTDVGFRSLCYDFGAEMCCTEMISAKALNFDSEKTKSLLLFEDNYKFRQAQLFGNDPKEFAKAIQNPILKDFDVIDINMGCPAPKIVKNHEGSFLLTNMDLAYDIVRACCDSTDKPISVKMRLGYGNENVATTFAKKMEKAGASFITVHGRTQAQAYMGKVDMQSIKNVKQEVAIPVVANGDIVDEQSLQEMKKVTNADGFMIGRGALGKPFLFKQLISNVIENNQEKTQKSLPNIEKINTNTNVNLIENSFTNFDKNYNNIKYDLIQKHINIMKKYYDEKFVNLNMRKQIAFYLKNTGADAKLKQQLMIEEDLNKVLEILKDFFEKLQQ